jgi:predicted secreted protein
MTKKLQAVLVALLALLGTLAGAGQAAAEPRPTSDLLLPYFEVDLEAPGTATTLFAVVNSRSQKVPVGIEVRTDWGIPMLKATLTLEPRQVRTFNLRDWLIAGRLPDRDIDKAELAHLAAALTGRRSPKDGLYYSTEKKPGLAVGSVVIRTLGPDFSDALWGDYFYIDTLKNLSSGDTLVDIDGTHCPGLCKRHALRFLAGAAFDAGTEVVFWTDKAGRPSASPVYPYADFAVIDATAYDEPGKALGGHEIDALPVEVKKVGELALAQPFGWLELRTEETSYFGVRYSAEGRYSVAFQSWCLPEELPPSGPAIRIRKLTNGADADLEPGPSIAVGAAVTWTYEVTNTGDVPLSDVRVTDDKGVAVSCPKDALAVGESMDCTGHGVAEACQYANLGTATGTPPNAPDVSDFDMSHYFGALNARIDLELLVEGQDADDTPGPTIAAGSPVHWTYQVRNTGDTELTGVAVKDGAGAAVACPKSTLKAGESMTCSVTGPAAAGAHSEVATASGQPSCGGAAADSDPAHYTVDGPKQPRIKIKKATNGEDADAAPGPEIPVGGAVTWTYVVTNNGDVALTGVQVTDNKGVAVSCPKTSLAVGESMTCTGHGTATAGQYENIGSVTGNPPSGSPVSSSDPSHYYGKTTPNPRIKIKKATNGEDADAAPGPKIPVGGAVTWTYVVTNNGDVALTGVQVTDNKGVAVSCPKTSLAVGESMTCTGHGTATAGQYENIGSATGNPPSGPPVSASDPSHYYGEIPPPPGGEGCTPGYWKNHTDSWPPTGYSPSQLVKSVFSQAVLYPALGNSTLLEGLSFPGGETLEGAAEILLRASVAALLDSSHPGVDYPRTTASVISDVNAALASQDRDTMIGLASDLDKDNNLGCPLN